MRKVKRLVHYYAKAFEERSGVTAAIGSWANSVARAGLESVVVGREGPFEQAFCGAETVPHVGRSRRSYVPLGLHKVLRAGDVLVLHEGWVVSNLVASEVARGAKVPYLVMPHGVYEPEVVAGQAGQRIRLLQERRVLSGALAIHLFFPGERGLVREVVGQAFRVIVAPNGVALSSRSWNGGGEYLSWLGRLDIHHKGLDILLDALSQIPSSVRPLLHIRGYDFRGGRDRLQLLIRERGIGNYVELGPRVDGDEKEAFMAASRGYLHVSRWDACPIALLEHMAMGVPSLVSTALHIAKELQMSGVAKVVPPESRLIAAALESWSPSLGESERLKDFTVRHFSWDQLADSFLAQLDRIWASTDA